VIAAEIRVLPVRPRGSDQSAGCARISSPRTRAARISARAPHIQGCGERLPELSHVFEQAIGRMDQSLDDLTLRDPGTGAALRHLLGS